MFPEKTDFADRCPRCRGKTERFKYGIKCKRTLYVTILEIYVGLKKNKNYQAEMRIWALRLFYVG